METPPNEKKLRTISFAAHATRGLIRDARTRRRTMALVLGAALLMLIGGSTLLRSALDPRAHLGWFVLYWLACSWLTLTALLLAIFDLLLVRAQGRREQKELRHQHSVNARARRPEE
jgi:hypothetical protein